MTREMLPTRSPSGFTSNGPPQRLGRVRNTWYNYSSLTKTPTTRTCHCVSCASRPLLPRARNFLLLPLTLALSGKTAPQRHFQRTPQQHLQRTRSTDTPTTRSTDTFNGHPQRHVQRTRSTDTPNGMSNDTFNAHPNVQPNGTFNRQ